MHPEPSFLPRPIPETYWVAPGRFLAGEYPGVPWMPERTRQRLDAFLSAGFDTFFDLTVSGETEPYEALLREQAGYYAVSVRYVRFPIGDFGLPQPAQMTAILDSIHAALAEGRKLYLHCYGGIGRTGTVVGCYLVRQGLTGQQALEQLAAWWRGVPKSHRYPHSPETLQQEEFVRAWERQKLLAHP
ncbi:MAG: hypothetical protein N2117_00140 [Anaerolineales bacterium]|nr:hypothetical protein [Anaerolineales bacterium]MCX7753638.1 hypothetical protein [Anaerolineales bacterium]MDW8277712.1 hypothetical protein [Anaerolineales bacterium]